MTATGTVPIDSGAGGTPAPRETARAQLIAAHLAEAARFEVVSAALRGETLDQISARFADVLDVRLRNDLGAAAEDVVGQINGQ